MTWDFLVNPLVTLLTLFYSVMGNNIVLAIALLTILIRLATSPLLIQQQRSTVKMQEIQPKLRAIQEKYKNDREKLSQEQMKLYQENGINPFGGCLPLFIQLPILFALYATINHALAATPYQLIDNAGRLLIPSLEPLFPLNKIWLQMDLTQFPTTEAAHAPWALVLPILVLATTWLQSKLTIPAPQPSADGKPNPAESMTRSMTTVMPLLYGFFALSFPIGMSIYFIVTNVVGIAQYSLMGKADWGALVGRPTRKPALASGVMVDDALTRPESIAPRSTGRSSGSSNGLAVKEVVGTRSNSTSSGTKTKNRRKK